MPNSNIKSRFYFWNMRLLRELLEITRDKQLPEFSIVPLPFSTGRAGVANYVLFTLVAPFAEAQPPGDIANVMTQCVVSESSRQRRTRHRRRPRRPVRGWTILTIPLGTPDDRLDRIQEHGAFVVDTVRKGLRPYLCKGAYRVLPGHVFEARWATLGLGWL